MEAFKLEATELRYSSDSEPGFSRLPEGDGFRYVDSRGKPVTDPRSLERIRSLAVPPAYSQVWICEDPLGHLQATGRDARGRKQYRYHPQFREHQEKNKFNRLIDFGRALPKIRTTLNDDLRLTGVPKRKVMAVVVTLLDRTLIRVGNEEYVKENHSFGLTTLRERHVLIHGAALRFRFPGKSHVRHEIEVHDRRLARLVSKIEELPGQELFHYLDDAGTPKAVSSTDVNEYLREISESSFSAKDFRTWWATVLAFQQLAGLDVPATERLRKQAVTSAVKSVAERLGNTPAICRKCYIHPRIFECFRSGSLGPAQSSGEAAVLCLLEGIVTG